MTHSEVSEKLSSVALQFIVSSLTYGVVVTIASLMIGNLEEVSLFMRVAGLVVLGVILGSGMQKLLQLDLPFRHAIATILLVLGVGAILCLAVLTGVV